jgi:protein-L-isoaspartate O-methyltransferase
VVAATPRHVFVPRWWATPPGATWGRWELRDGSADEAAWLATAYTNASLVIEVEGRHADHLPVGTLARGTPTSSSAMPRLVLRMLRHAQLYAGADVLHVGTGSGYGRPLPGGALSCLG